MKKLSILMMMLTAFLSADTKIYEDYVFNQAIDSKEFNLTESPTFSNAPYLKVYADTVNGVNLITTQGKLQVVEVIMDDFDLKTEIEAILKQGLRLKKIKLSNKFGEHNVSNLGEMFSFIEDEFAKSSVFDVLVSSELTFENEIDNVKVFLVYEGGINRDPKDCRICDKLEGSDSVELNILKVYFTALKKD